MTIQGCQVKLEFQINNELFLIEVCSVQYLGHTYSRKFVVYLKFNFNWVSYIYLTTLNSQCWKICPESRAFSGASVWSCYLM